MEVSGRTGSALRYATGALFILGLLQIVSAYQAGNGNQQAGEPVYEKLRFQSQANRQQQQQGEFSRQDENFFVSKIGQNNAQTWTPSTMTITSNGEPARGSNSHEQEVEILPVSPITTTSSSPSSTTQQLATQMDTTTAIATTSTTTPSATTTTTATTTTALTSTAASASTTTLNAPTVNSTMLMTSPLSTPLSSSTLSPSMRLVTSSTPLPQRKSASEKKRPLQAKLPGYNKEVSNLRKLGENSTKRRPTNVDTEITATTTNVEPLELLSTSQSLSFADPIAEATSSAVNSQENTNKFGSSSLNSNSNRWTHFGARIRPLSNQLQQEPTREHHQVAASKSLPAAFPVMFGGEASQQRQQSQQQGPRFLAHQGNGKLQLASNLNGLASNSAEAKEDDDDDDELDSEALLYKLMQQQGFLMGPNWQDQAGSSNGSPSGTATSGEQSANGLVRSSSSQSQGYNSDANLGASNDFAGLTTPATSALQTGSSQANSNGNNNHNSRRVMRLLKSYSHIHQVDDSDDQIRGTNNRIQNRRVATTGNDYNDDNGNIWSRGTRAEPRQQRMQSFNRNRPQQSAKEQSQAAQSSRQQKAAIFVSSQPRAFSGTNGVGLTPSNSNGQRQFNQPIAHNHFAGQASSQPEASGDESGSDDESDASPSQGGPDSSVPNGGPGGPSEEEEFECPNNGIFADEASGCQAYHVCQSGAQVQEKFQCPLGTLFNNIILTCDFAHNVQCGRSKQTVPLSTQSAAALQPNNPRQGASGEVGPRPGPQRQEPRASNQIHQASLVRAQQPPVRVQSGPKNSDRLIPTSPRQQLQRANQAQAIEAYPVREPSSTSGPRAAPQAGNDNSSEDDDDDAPEPLVPATLPPMRIVASSLPYNPPPPPQQQQRQSLPVAVYAPQQQQRSAHRSQYPTNQPQQAMLLGQPPMSFYQSQGGGSYASEATPVFVGREEAANSSNGRVPVESSNVAQVSSSSEGNNESHSFNLVINHQTAASATPKRQEETRPSQGQYQVAPQLQQVRSVTTQKQQQQHLEPMNVYQIAPKREARRETYNQAPLSQVAFNSNRIQHQPQLQQQPARQQSSANGYNEQSRQRQPETGNARYQQQASAPAPAHYEVVAQTNQRAKQQAPVIDMTGNSANAGVSSEALNEGLLLIVRHAPNSAPLQLVTAPSSSNSQSNVATSDNARHSAASFRMTSIASPLPNSGNLGQAYAVNPQSVRADSPVDAQLFPHVQSFVASRLENGQSRGHLTNQYYQNNRASAASESRPAAQVTPSLTMGQIHGPLPPMEPPKPTALKQHKHPVNRRALQVNFHELSSSQELAVAASAPISSTPETVKSEKSPKPKLPVSSTTPSPVAGGSDNKATAKRSTTSNSSSKPKQTTQSSASPKDKKDQERPKADKPKQQTNEKRQATPDDKSNITTTSSNNQPKATAKRLVAAQPPKEKKQSAKLTATESPSKPGTVSPSPKPRAVSTTTTPTNEKQTSGSSSTTRKPVKKKKSTEATTSKPIIVSTTTVASSKPKQNKPATSS